MIQEHKKFVAFIPVRGGSKSIPLKNIKMFCGKPLIYWTLKAASQAVLIETVYVATDDERIRKTVEELSLPKVVVIDRSSYTATDNASTESAMLEFAENYKFENIILIQATSPLLEDRDLEGAICRFVEDRADSLLSVVRQKRFIWLMEEGFCRPMNYNPSFRPRRQEWDGYLVENGAFYITSRKKLIETGCRISGNVSFYEMKEESYFEIDEESDWVILEQLKKKTLNKGLFSGIHFTKINLLITDVDGVLTDAGMYYSETGDELKKFNTRDGKGIELLRNAGIKVMFLTSEDVALVRKRAEKLKVDFIYTGVGNKKEFLDDFFDKNREFEFGRTAYIGDDINDLECIQAAYFSAAPKDGVAEVRNAAVHVCSLGGGQGCVRELCHLILKSDQ